MELHKQVKPHHHIAVWAVIVLVTLFAATVSMSNAVTVSAEQDGSADVTDKTKKFFNFEDGEDGNFIEPAACKEPSKEHQALMTKNEELNQEMQELNNIDTTSYTEAQITEHQKKLDAIFTEMKVLGESFESIEYGPSDDCKIAIVTQMKVQMSAMNSQMDTKLFATLDRVTTTITKVKGIIDGITETDNNTDALAKVDSNISTIELNVGRLRSFFTIWKNEMTKFLDAVTANPLKAYDDMQNFGSGSDDRGAARAADQLVISFEALEINIDKLVKIEGSSG